MKKHLILAVALISLLPVQVFAGGSVSYQEDIKSLIEKQPALKQLLLTTFKVPNIGVGLRLGRHFTELGGARVAPYEFEVTSRATGEKFILTIHCDTVFKLANGKTATEDEMLKATEIEETFTHFSVAPLPKEEKGE